MSDKPSPRRGTATSNFGVGRRESHDATAFYDRFVAPTVSTDEQVAVAAETDTIWVHDAREMPELPDGSVALVVTSPPYFAGKAYEEALGEGHIPADYVEYLGMLEAVFAECVRVLEPGGRIAVNVANLGRKPYRSLSADVIEILQDRLGLLLRGEIIWQKAQGAGGNCAWGSFASPANPVLRDISERIIVASKGRFDRARTAKQRQRDGLPGEATIDRDAFMDLTLDVWSFPPESATRVGHPAPFPVELPARLIELYTYRDDLVLDPFMGSGSTGVAAVAVGRRFAGYDTDADYAAAALARIDEAREAADSAADADEASGPPRVDAPEGVSPEALAELIDLQRRSRLEGTRAQQLVAELLERSGFDASPREKVQAGAGVEVDFEIVDRDGTRWLFDLSGAFGSTRPGLRRADVLWKSVGRAAVVAAAAPSGQEPPRWVAITTDLPDPSTAGHKALMAAQADGGPVWDVLHLEDPRTAAALLGWAAAGRAATRPERPTALTRGS